uniref:Uncharacterized protein n=1 Tax=Timema tahoe TaxID=61484 RepID=A0A7R9IGK6_9NEOP|nr:unnamed protein product [Timema tahoe]
MTQLLNTQGQTTVAVESSVSNDVTDILTQINTIVSDLLSLLSNPVSSDLNETLTDVSELLTELDTLVDNLSDSLSGELVQTLQGITTRIQDLLAQIDSGVNTDLSQTQESSSWTVTTTTTTTYKLNLKVSYQYTVVQMRTCLSLAQTYYMACQTNMNQALTNSMKPSTMDTSTTAALCGILTDGLQSLQNATDLLMGVEKATQDLVKITKSTDATVQNLVKQIQDLTKNLSSVVTPEINQVMSYLNQTVLDELANLLNQLNNFTQSMNVSPLLQMNYLLGDIRYTVSKLLSQLTTGTMVSDAITRLLNAIDGVLDNNVCVVSDVVTELGDVLSSLTAQLQILTSQDLQPSINQLQILLEETTMTEGIIHGSQALNGTVTNAMFNDTANVASRLYQKASNMASTILQASEALPTELDNISAGDNGISILVNLDHQIQEQVVDLLSVLEQATNQTSSYLNGTVTNNLIVLIRQLNILTHFINNATAILIRYKTNQIDPVQINSDRGSFHPKPRMDHWGHP